MVIPEKEVQYKLMSPGGYLYAHIIGIGSNNPRWVKSGEQVIDDIENEDCRYYVQHHLSSRKKYLRIVKPDELVRSTWYLRTYPDSTPDNSLLSLPSYPNYPNELAA